MSIKVIAKKLTTKKRNALSDAFFAIPASHPKNKGKKDKFPINDENHGRNAISRVNQFSAVPDWWSGSVQELVNTVVRKVKSKFPKIEISDKAKKKKAELSEIIGLLVTSASHLDSVGLIKEGTVLDNITRLLIATEPLTVQQPPTQSVTSAKPSSGQVDPDAVQAPTAPNEKKNPNINKKTTPLAPPVATTPPTGAPPDQNTMGTSTSTFARPSISSADKPIV